MRKLLNYIVVFLFFLLSLGQVSAQETCFIQLDNFTGFELSQSEFDELNQAACELVDSLPVEFRDSFKVYSFGFYHHNEVMTGSYDEILDIVENDSLKSKYFLLYGKVFNIDNEIRYKVRAKIPNYYSNCIDVNHISLSISQLLNSTNNNFLNFSYESEITGFYRFFKIIDDIYNCCNESNFIKNKKNKRLTESLNFCNTMFLDFNFNQGEVQNKIDYSGYYFAPTGKIIFLDKNVNNINFYWTGNAFSDSKQRGAVMSFTLNDGSNWSAYGIKHPDTTFAGYRKVIDDENGGKKESDSYLFSTKNINYPVKLCVGFNYNFKDCSSRIYAYNYDPYNPTQNETSADGGVGLPFIDSLNIDYSLKQVKIDHVQNSNGVVISPEIKYTYYGDSFQYATLYLPDIYSVPCPDREISEIDLLKTGVDSTLVYNDGCFLHRTSKGYFYWQLQPDAAYQIFIYYPGVGYLPHTLPNHEWLNPGDVFEAVLSETWQTLTDPHAILFVVAISDIPIVSQLADIADATIYFIEGDKGNGVVSLLGTLPGAYFILKSGKYTIKLGASLKAFNKVTKKYDNISAKTEIEDFIHSLNITDVAQASRLQNAFENGIGFGDEVIKNKYVVQAWKLFDDADLSLKLNDPNILGDLERLIALGDDIKLNSQLRNYLNSTTAGVKSWEKLFSKPSWRTNTTYLTKVSRYTDNGLEIVEEGGELVVKQADGLVVGKLDPNDVLDPGQMKVLGESSARHFDPDDAGGIIIKKSWANPTIDQSGIDDITTHLSRFEDPAGDNAFMIQRLQDIKDGNITITDYDKRFYTHELEEYARYQNKGILNGVNEPDFYYNAHTASLESYSINEQTEPLYHPR